MTSLTFFERGQTVRITDEAPVAMMGAPCAEISGEGPLLPGLYGPDAIVFAMGDRTLSARQALASSLLRQKQTGAAAALVARFLSSND